MKDKFEQALENLNTEAADKLYRARVYLAPVEGALAPDNAFEILFWAEYRVRGDLS